MEVKQLFYLSPNPIILALTGALSPKRARVKFQPNTDQVAKHIQLCPWHVCKIRQVKIYTYTIIIQ